LAIIMAAKFALKTGSWCDEKQVLAIYLN
jgi:hypothetical protein